MTKWIYDQMGRNTTLLPPEQSALILAGSEVPAEDVIKALTIGAQDCAAVIGCDPQSTRAERSLGRLCLILAFLLAIAGAKE